MKSIFSPRNSEGLKAQADSKDKNQIFEKSKNSGTLKNNSEQRSDLVAEQPGFWWAFTFSLIAWFLGFWTTTWLKPDQMQKAIQTAAHQIHPELKVSFESASLSLSNNGIPEFALHIQGLVLVSSEVCWMSPTLEIVDLRLPLSMLDLLQGQVSVDTASASDVNLTLKAPLTAATGGTQKACNRFQLSAKGPEASIVGLVNGAAPGANTPISTAAVNAERGPQPSFHRLQVNHFRISTQFSSEVKFLVDDLDVEILSAKEALVRGEVNFGEQTPSGFFSSHSKMSFHYFDDRNWPIEFEGVWREGLYKLGAEINPRSGQFTAQGDLRHLPANLVLQLLERLSDEPANVDLGSTWFSAAFKANGNWMDFSQSEFEFSQFRAEGDLGEINSPQIVVQKIKPFSWRAKEVDFKSLKLERLGFFSARPPFIGKVGFLRGRARIENPRTWFLEGELSGAEVILGTGALRHPQVISLMNVQAQRNPKEAKVELSSIQLAEGSFLGKIFAELGENLNSGNIKLQIDDAVLSPLVQKSILGGSLGSFSGLVQMHLQQNEFTELTANLNFDQMSSPFFEMRGVRVQGVRKKGLSRVQLFANQLNWSSAIPFGQYRRIIGTFENREKEKKNAGDQEENFGRWVLARAPQIPEKTSEKDSAAKARSAIASLTAQGTFSESGEILGEFQWREQDQKKSYRIQGPLSQMKMTVYEPNRL